MRSGNATASSHGVSGDIDNLNIGKQHTFYIHEVEIESDVPLGEHLRVSGISRHRVRLYESTGADELAETGVMVATMEAHGELLKAHSDRNSDSVEPGQPWCVSIDQRVQFSWVSGTREIRYHLLPDGDLPNLSFWFTHIVLPVFLASENLYDFLHAAAVMVDERALVLVAPTTGGKSTLANYFIQQGHALITDDKLATYVQGDHVMATASHRYHRPYRAHQEIGVEAPLSTDKTLPISAIFNLKRPPGATELDLRELEGAEKIAALLDNSMFAFKHRARSHFRFLYDLVSRVYVFEVLVPDELDRLGEVYTLIMNQISAEG